MRHINIPIFIPHLGCPNQCVFCNQRTISGQASFSLSDVRNQINRSISTINEPSDVEIAFFGGSFTGIDRELMVDLLEIAYSYVTQGKVNSIRCSTRPDYINEEILDILKKYGVKTIELGLQSVCENVLVTTKRGHSFSDEEKACELIVKHGFDLVGQMMIGLPGADVKSEIDTADYIIKSGAIAARIYPTVVFCETELAKMTADGTYKPLAVDEAVKRSAHVFERFVEAGIDVIRIGLQSNENLSSDKTYVAGPNHPALGELVIGEYYFYRICEIIKNKELSSDSELIIYVAPGAISKAVGQNKINKTRLLERCKSVKFSSLDTLCRYELLVDIKNGEKKCT